MRQRNFEWSEMLLWFDADANKKEVFRLFRGYLRKQKKH